MKEPKILLFDIETAPITALVWGTWDQNVASNQILQDWWILSWAAKWLGNDKVMHSALPEFKKGYAKDPTDDSHILKKLIALFDEADIIVGHNGDKFDIKKVNARLVYHGIKPYAPVRSIDTLKIAKAHFKFTSNRLDALGEFLGVGKKAETGGMDLWKSCMNGDKAAWAKMIAYNKQDVVLLEAVYLKLRPWMSSHPNLAVVADADSLVCPKCLGTHFQSRGYSYTNSGRYRRYQCQNSICGTWLHGKTEPLVLTPLKNTGRK